MTWFESDPFPLAGAKESNSSKKMTHGEWDLAFSNISLMFFSLSPTYMFRISGPLTDIKLSSHSVAIAFARSVFPVPGGP
eukprot:CAMPEP_0197013230 /NCGR_PEP_ID=MMETSP1380-20130617/65599_1 /TAXON_ID=5936 /ORGANISM="Euplotes crassus, Strain CT5" /LENGTH=79 /DNA_ID=CAMNT_0042437323 /DNA_START=34 /DNA_END=273 /DNA_ORIENTATION=+